MVRLILGCRIHCRVHVGRRWLLSAVAGLRRARALVVCCRRRCHVPLLLLSLLWRASAVLWGLRSLQSVVVVTAEVEVFFTKLFADGRHGGIL
jgi:hypothetical protein